MWRSKYLRRLIGAAFLAIIALTLVEWRLHHHTEEVVAVRDAHGQLATAALALDALDASVTAALGEDGALSHLSLSGPISRLDREAAEAVKRVARADVVIVGADEGRPQLVAQTLEDPQALALSPDLAGAGPLAVAVAGVERMMAQVPILRASDDAPVGFLRVFAVPAAEPILPLISALAAPILTFFGLAAGIVWIYASDRKTFLTIGDQIRDLTKGECEIDLKKYNPTGAIYPIMHAVSDLCARYAEAAEKNETALKSELAARTELDGMLSQLDAEMGCLVSDLARGDFSQPILSQFDFPEVQSLAESIQTMADTMESFLKETAQVLTAMAEGELRVEMSGDYTGEFKAVEESANSSIRQFRTLISDVQGTVGEGLAAVTHIGTSVQNLARRANEQVAAIQETAAAMEQISTAVRNNTEAMVEADKMAQGVALSTRSGGVAARGAIAAVERIRDSSQEISDIVRVIETIAFQTTILALNSAIEAARAGEAGRGFSVVATEVRSLAQRSSDAAKQIKTLITSSEQMVIEGVEMVQSAGSALHEIESGIQSLSGRLAQVARSQIEQANSVSQINANIANIESLAAESAALCENSGAETEGLSASMERVGAQMGRFKVEGAPPASARSAQRSTAGAPVPASFGSDADPSEWMKPHGDDGASDFSATTQWNDEDWAKAG